MPDGNALRDHTSLFLNTVLSCHSPDTTNGRHIAIVPSAEAISISVVLKLFSASFEFFAKQNQKPAAKSNKPCSIIQGKRFPER